MRKFWLFLLLTACGPEVATTETAATSASSGSTGDPSTSTAPTTSTGDPATTTDDPGTTGTTGTTTDTTDATTTDASTGDTTTGTACLEVAFKDPREFPEQPHFTCGLPELCSGGSPLVFEWDPDGWTTNNIVRARCIVAALRDRTPGQFRYQNETHDDFQTLEVLGEQVITVDEYHGIGFGFDYAERITFLKSSKFFAECIDGTADDIHQCLQDGFTDECAGTRDCPD